jgi:membrane-associated phospholipid phosphatase
MTVRLTAGRSAARSPRSLAAAAGADRFEWVSRIVLGAGLLGGTWSALHRPLVQRADVRVGDALRYLGNPGVDRIVAGTTELGSLYGVLGCAAGLALAGRPQMAADVLGVGGSAWTLAQTNKRLVRRERPYEAHGVRRLVRPPTGSSFPSGHSAVGMAMMATVAEQAVGGRRLALQAMGAYVGASRVYVGVHYPSDAIGGAGLGLLLSGLWRGPVALAGRAGTKAATRTARRVLPTVARGAALAAVGVQVGRRMAREPEVRRRLTAA